MTSDAASRHLIVNADDFGLSSGVNKGVIEAHQRGIVTSASLMVRREAAGEAAAYGREHPRLDLGLHLDLGEWRYGGGGWTPRYSVVDCRDPAAVSDEVERQLARFEELTGRGPTHIDSHQHVHREEPVAEVLRRVRRRLGVPVRHQERAIRYRGDFYGQTSEGEPVPGAVSAESLVRLIETLPVGTTELSCHPGYARADQTSYWQEREHEVAALCDSSVRAALGANDVALTSFSESQSRWKASLAPKSPKRVKVSVLCWNVGHNPLGRAHVLADLLRSRYEVELVGCQFAKFGDGVWAPLRDAPLPLRCYRGADFPDFLPTLDTMARELGGDVIYVSKPRLPSLLPGILAKHLRNRPVLVDCDDLELSFVGADEGLALGALRCSADDGDLAVPHGRLWTQHCDTLVPCAEAVTVSSSKLAERYGGTVIPHARDERVFDPARHDRAAGRALLGVGPDDRVVLFVGTPRRHKGIGHVARALQSIGNPRYRLCVIGDVGELRSELVGLERWVTVLPPQPFELLPTFLCAADAMCVIQDEASAVAHWQMPAKITDALAMGVPCVVTATPPLLPLVQEGLVEAVTGDALPHTLDQLLSDPQLRAGRSAAARRAFVDRFSYGAVRPTLEAVVEGALASPPRVPAEFEELIEFQRQAFGSVAAHRA